MGKFDGKVLLVLGSNVGSVDIVQYAKSNGAKVLVADYYLMDKSEAKRFSDKNFLVSTADLEELGNIIKKYKVDAVLSGISEFNIIQAMELSEKYSLPFYCTKKQWNMIEHKNKFREMCVKYNVPCPSTYYIGGKMMGIDKKDFKFPLVIKPIDGCASAGVHICNDIQELEYYEQESLDVSKNRQIIVEEFVEGEEFTAHYTIANGEVALSCIDNRYPVSVHEGTVTTVPIARVYPCKYINEYLVKANDQVINLCKSLNITNGILFVQGLYNAYLKKFYIFEAGLRSAAEAPYRFISKINGINPLYLLVDDALSVKSEYKIKNEDPYMHGKCCGVISFVTIGGTVGKIIGLEESIKHLQSVIEYEVRYPEGSVAPKGDTLRQLMLRFVMVCDNKEKMKKDITYLNEHIFVLNNMGENMVIKPLIDKIVVF